MPNHVATNLYVSGPVEDVNRFIAGTVKGESVDLTVYLPLPQELQGTRSPTMIVSQAEYDENKAYVAQRLANTAPEDVEKLDWDYEFSKRSGCLTAALSKEYRAKFGADNWYDWHIQNWGSKWGAYDATEWDVIEAETGATGSIFYNTAWSPLEAYFLAVSKQFPTLVFLHEFADEGGGFVGNQTIQDGEILSEEDYDWDSDEGIFIREAVGYGPSEYIDEDEDEDE